MNDSRRERRVSYSRRNKAPNRRRPLNMELLEDRVVLSTFIVDNIADSGVGTLRQAILDAASNAEADTIDFDPSLAGQTITLTSDSTNLAFGPTALTIVDDDITIDGAGAPMLQISGNDARRIFAVGIGATLTLENITLTGGRSQGGAGGDTSGGVIAPTGGGAAGMGGAIYVYQGTLNIENSTLYNNTAQGGRGGNGGFTAGMGGATGGGSIGGDGGGFDNVGPGGGGGGGVGGPGTINSGATGGDGGGDTLGQATAPGADGLDGAGGGGGSNGTSGGSGASISNGGFGGGGGGGFGTVDGFGDYSGGGGGDGGFGAGGGGGSNGSGGAGGFGGGGGGGGGGHVGTTGLGGFGGGDGGLNGGGGGGGAGMGGAIFSNSGTVNIYNSTFTGNTAAGGAGGLGPNSNSGVDGEGFGGAIFNYNSTLTVNSATMSGNTAEGGIGIYNLADQAFSTVELNNSILAPSNFDETDFVSDSINTGVAPTSGSGNLIMSNVGFNGDVASSADPLLGPLAVNGGPTQTMLPSDTSPVLSAGDYAVNTLATDQRGLTRTLNSTIDIGAVQVNQPVPPTLTNDPGTSFAVGSNGTFTFTTNGTPIAALTYTGALPSGVTFTDNGDGTATLSGTPDVGQEGDYTITIVASSGTPPDDSQTFTLTVCPPLAISPTVLPQPAVGSAYSEQLTASGGSGLFYTFWAIGLPSGMSISLGGLISGTPTNNSGSPYSVNIILADGFWNYFTQHYTFVVNPALTLSPADLPQAALGSQYTQQLTASGGSGSGYTFSATGLPDGLSMDGDGLISGTPIDNADSPYTVDVTVTDDQGASFDQTFSLIVNQALAISPTDLPQAALGSQYTQQLTASGGSGSGYTFSATGLPDGLSIGSLGLITGIPTDNADSPYTVDVTVTDDQGASFDQTFSLIVNQALAISPADLPESAVGSYYSQQLTATGGTGAGYSFWAGDLPAGLSIDSNGLISGTPTVNSGSPYTFDVDVTDGDGNSYAQPYTLIVNNAIEFAPVDFPPATVANAFSYTFTATGGSGLGYVFTTNSTLPDGLTLGLDGVLSGTPTDNIDSPYCLQILVTDGQGASASEYVQLAINPALTIAPDDLPIATVGSAYSQQLVASGGSGLGYTFSATGLPDGLSIDSLGLITGIPTTNLGSPFSVIVTLTDSNNATGVATYSLAVDPAITVDPATLAGGFVGVAYTQQLTASGGSGEGYTFSADDLPEGIELSPTGLLSGTPTSATGSPFTFIVTTTDGIGATGAQTFVLNVDLSGSTTGLMTSGSPGIWGQSVTFTAWVQSAGPVVATPTGSITFMDGANVLQEVPIYGGVAYLNITSLSPGSHDITAVYNGDGLFHPSTSSVITQTMMIESATTLTSSTDSPSYGQPVTFTMTVASQPPLAPSGLVGFYDGDTLIGTAMLDANGAASFTTDELSVGQHAIKAVYAGDAYFLAVAAQPINVTVAQNTSTTGDVASSANQIYYGQTVTLSATFTANSTGAPLTGTVAFYDGDTFLGTAPINAPPQIAALSTQPALAALTAPTATGQAVLPSVSLSVGAHVIRAVYSGDANYAPATSTTTASITVDQAQTSTTLAADTAADGSTTLTATVVATTPGAPQIAGTVDFFDAGTYIGTSPINAGVAIFNTGILPPGNHVFSAVYSGTGGTSTSSASVVVNTAGPQVVGLSRYGFHYSPTTLVLNFNSPLDPASAQMTSNYVITNSGGRRIPVSRAVYDPSSWTVTLSPSQQLNLHWSYKLVVNGQTPNGLTGASGIPLDGSGQNQPGTNFTTTVTWRALAVPGDPASVVYNDGTVQTTGARFNSYVNAVVVRTRRAAASIVRSLPIARTVVNRPLPTPRAAVNHLIARVWRPSR